MSGICDTCIDDRFELIGKAKAKLLEATNIESRPEEVAMLDSILFRCWQVGWLDKLRDNDSRYSELFGTPERVARTLEKGKTLCAWCDKQTCSTSGGECRIYDYDALLEWLRGDADA